MNFAPPLLGRVLAQARADWLAGDPAAWSRYTNCLAQLERHLVARPSRREPTRPHRLRRPGLRAPRGLA